MSEPEVVVHGNSELLAAASAARLITKLANVQASNGTASVVLTGGGTGIAVLEHVLVSPARDAVDWARVDVYWGDERFVPAEDDERNEKQAREALLDHVGVDPARVHPMAAADSEFGDDVDAAAAGYGQMLAEHARASGANGSPAFDVTLLGLGAEGHTASIFPDSPALRADDAAVVAVRDCPKPPPTRISLTLPAIRRSREVWVITAGQSKAEATTLALAGADETHLPVAGARGEQRTLWLVDALAAEQLDRVQAARP